MNFFFGSAASENRSYFQTQCRRKNYHSFHLHAKLLIFFKNFDNSKSER